MRWNKVEGAGDIDDQRGRRRPGVGAGVGGLGVGGVLIVLALQLLSGGKFEIPAGFDQALSAGTATGQPPTQEENTRAEFTKAIAADDQDLWTKLFQQDGQRYDRSTVVLFTDAVSTGCGNATKAVGPFYCPADSRVYLDLSFYDDMREQLGANGDFAWAYVVAHELGHHVQNLVGTNAKVSKLEREDPGAADGAQGLSVRTELQADCYAGVWAHSVYSAGDLEDGDLNEAIGAAQAVGDDRLQSRSSSGVQPDTFTHGTSAQRQRWFKVGFDSGAPGECDTFSPDSV